MERLGELQVQAYQHETWGQKGGDLVGSATRYEAQSPVSEETPRVDAGSGKRGFAVIQTACHRFAHHVVAVERHLSVIAEIQRGKAARVGGRLGIKALLGAQQLTA